MSLAQYAHESPKQKAQHHEIEVRYRSRKGNRCAPKTNCRVKDLERVFARQYGRLLPDDDAGRDCVYIMANHLAHRDAAEPRIRFWVRRWAPWYTAAEMADLLAQVLPNPIKWSADELGERIGLLDAVRTGNLPAVSGDEGVASLEVAMRCLQDGAEANAPRAPLRVAG